ncbi:FRG domain-containing protein [Mesorhizobium sp. ORM8.1]
MPVVEKEVGGIEGLLTEVLNIRSSIPAGHFIWFRGARLDSHQLLPKIMRDGRAVDDVFEREKRLLTRFRQRSLAYWPAGYPQNDWEHLFAMQHYGVPTRLLDWSENLFVAAHFAFSNFSEGDAGQPVIWCVDPVLWNRKTPNLSEFGNSIYVLTTADDDAEGYRPETTKRRNRTPVAIFGTHNSQRIVAQRGTFFVWGNDTTSLEAFARDSEAHLWKFRIAGARDELAASLRFLGFGETMVFPEMPSLAEELSRTEGWRRSCPHRWCSSAVVKPLASAPLVAL